MVNAQIAAVTSNAKTTDNEKDGTVVESTAEVASVFKSNQPINLMIDTYGRCRSLLARSAARSTWIVDARSIPKDR